MDHTKERIRGHKGRGHSWAGLEMGNHLEKLVVFRPRRWPGRGWTPGKKDSMAWGVGHTDKATPW
jgi:hypothetical protein